MRASCINPQWTNVLMLSGDSLYDKPKERNKQPLENPYSVLDAPSEQPTVIKEAYDVPKDNDDPEHVYFTADDNGGHSNDSNAYIYDEQNEAAVRASGLLCVCLSVCLSVCTYVCLTWLVRPSFFSPFHVSLCMLSLSLSVSLCVSLSLSLSVC